MKNNVIFSKGDLYEMTEEAKRNVIFDLNQGSDYINLLKNELTKAKIQEKLTKEKTEVKQAKIKYQMAVALRQLKEMEDYDKHKRRR